MELDQTSSGKKRCRFRARKFVKFFHEITINLAGETSVYQLLIAPVEPDMY
jgi:hypothetical protein